MEVGVSGTNPPNAVFAHEDCGVGVVQEVAGQMGKFGKDLSGHLGVTRGGDKDTHSRRLDQARHELP